MVNKLWIVSAFLALSVNLAYAGKVNAKFSATPAPHFKDPITGMEMVYVKGGCYQMGTVGDDGYPEEKPVHKVCLDGFYIGKYEVTQRQWKLIMGASTSSNNTCDADGCPIDSVSWNDVQDFIHRLNSGNSDIYRLPTEAEWEYAARSRGKKVKYSGGKNLNSVAWYGENSGRKTHPVGTKAPNSLGIYDMSGNVWEWTNDWYESDYYENSPLTNPSGPGSGDDRVARGGCATGEADNQRVSRRTGYAPEFRKPTLGFRLLKVL